MIARRLVPNTVCLIPLVGDRLSLIPVAVALLEEPVAAAWETV